MRAIRTECHYGESKVWFRLQRPRLLNGVVQHRLCGGLTLSIGNLSEWSPPHNTFFVLSVAGQYKIFRYHQRHILQTTPSMKIVIIGSPGSGKSTLAQELGRTLAVERVIHLDRFFWRPGWNRTTTKERHEILHAIAPGESWIIEGHFFDTIDLQLELAETAILLICPPRTCLSRVIKRRIQHLIRQCPEIAPGCPDQVSLRLMKSIWEFHSIEENAVLERILWYRGRLEVVTLNSARSSIKSLLDEATSQLRMCHS